MLLLLILLLLLGPISCCIPSQTTWAIECYEQWWKCDPCYHQYINKTLYFIELNHNAVQYHKIQDEINQQNQRDIKAYEFLKRQQEIEDTGSTLIQLWYDVCYGFDCSSSYTLLGYICCIDGHKKYGQQDADSTFFVEYKRIMKNRQGL